jgi:hypothetical protein
MKIQEVITVHPKTDEQLNALKAFMQAFKIKFKVSKEESYNDDFIEKIIESKKQIESGNYTEIKQKEINSFIDSI